MKQVLAIIFSCLTSLVFCQNTKRPNFDISDFNKKFEVVRWLYEYDYVAWHTSDSVMTQDKKEISLLGNEWFCIEGQDHIWHALYGKYENGMYNLVFHFIADSNYKIKRVSEKVDSSITNTYSRALITANKKISALKDTIKVGFNQFIRQNEDKTFSVWIFPAFQQDYTAVYGGEFIYTIDKTGNYILKDDSYFQGNFRGFKVDKPREIWLNYSDTEKPTLGSIFFVWYYKKYFTQIFIECSKSNSSVIKADNEYTWIHLEKETEKKSKN
jgi:hypothetical protein